ncbi:S41 family peptidase [Candidatus Uhrbacteria bacterium]|nr:S41 family peptidase [Candidatus Uhrbacteria bacterium]
MLIVANLDGRLRVGYAVGTMRQSLPLEKRPFILLSRLATVAILASVFVSGLYLGRHQGMGRDAFAGEGRVLNQSEIPSSASQDVDFALFWDVWSRLKMDYYQQPVSDQVLFYGAMHGLVNGLEDPYTTFFDPDEAQAFLSDLSGSFQGIGAEIDKKDEQLRVVAPLPGSPSEQAGLLPGDSIFAIDGLETISMSVEEAVSHIRGERGTTVILTLGRDGVAEPFDVSIIRDTITISSVDADMREDGVMNVRIHTFNEDTPAQFAEAANDALAQGARGIILDLRSDPGGLLSSAIDVAGAWVGNQSVVLQRVRGETQPFSGTGSARLKDIPTVVLVNAWSASASEIVAGALQDYGLAKLVGEQTFGKGSVQDYAELPDGSAVKITVAEWLTPMGRSINHIGITPDVLVEWKPTNEVEAAADPQMEKALELLLENVP